jgi:hypothetical protein
VIFAALSLVAGLVSPGFLEADSCTHFMFARFALAEPHYLVNVWGRPFVTGIYALPAAIGGRDTGREMVRLTSLLLALIVAGVTYAIARRQQYRWPQLAFLFVLAQPLLFLHSFSELTEIPFAFLLVLGFWAYQKRQFLVMTLLIGLTPLARPEGFGFVLLAAAALILHRRYTWLLLLPVPLILWDYSGWVLYGREGAWWGWLIQNWPYAEESLYERGLLIHFLMRLPVIVSPLIFPAMWIGAWRSFREAGWDDDSARPTVWGYLRTALFGDHARRCEFLIVALPMLILIGHSLLYWMGKMASNGEVRYMLIVSPFWALLAAKGWEWVWERMRWRRPVGWAGAAALAPLVIQLIYPIVPLRLSGDWRVAQIVAAWYEKSSLRKEYPNLMASHPAIWYFLDRSPSGEGTWEWSRERIEQAPKGTLIIWDPIYGVYNSDARRSVSFEAIKAAGWVEDRQDESALNSRLPTDLRIADGADPGMKIFLSSKTVQGIRTPPPAPQIGPHLLGFNMPR